MQYLKPRFLTIGFLVCLMLPQMALAGRCIGSAYCKACSTCNYCKHCNSGGGTCGVCSQSSKDINYHSSSGVVAHHFWGNKKPILALIICAVIGLFFYRNTKRK